MHEIIMELKSENQIPWTMKKENEIRLLIVS